MKSSPIYQSFTFEGKRGIQNPGNGANKKLTSLTPESDDGKILHHFPEE
jgi:hypothetical protein